MFLLVGILIGIFIDQIWIYQHFKLQTAFFGPAKNLVVNLKPPITEVRISNVTSNSAIIEWSTDRETTGRIEACIFKTSGSRCTPGEEDSTPTTKHKLAIKNLEPGMTYDVTLIAVDKDENQINLALYGYLSTPPMDDTDSIDTQKPIISSPIVKSGTTATTISWETNEPTICKLLIWNNQIFKYSLLSENQSTKHVLQLDTNVFQKKQYKYQIIAEDGNGNISTSDEQTLILK